MLVCCVSCVLMWMCSMCLWMCIKFVYVYVHVYHVYVYVYVYVYDCVRMLCIICTDVCALIYMLGSVLAFACVC